jgi:hypothetical protein
VDIHVLGRPIRPAKSVDTAHTDLDTPNTLAEIYVWPTTVSSIFFVVSKHFLGGCCRKAARNDHYDVPYGQSKPIRVMVFPTVRSYGTGAFSVPAAGLSYTLRIVPIPSSMT